MFVLYLLSPRVVFLLLGAPSHATLHVLDWVKRVLRFCARNFVPFNALTFMGIASHLVLLGSCATFLLLTKVKEFCPVWTGLCAVLFSLYFLCRFAYVLHLCHFCQRLTGMSSTYGTCSPTIFAQPSGGSFWVIENFLQ